jgi:hypothetical protein
MYDTCYLRLAKLSDIIIFNEDRGLAVILSRYMKKIYKCEFCLNKNAVETVYDIIQGMNCRWFFQL